MSKKNKISSGYNLFLDDFRSLQDGVYCTGNIVYLLKPFIIVRDYETFCKTIEEKGVPLQVSFDHDLHPEHYGSEKLISRGQWLEYYKKPNKKHTGYCCAEFLINYCKKHNIPLPQILIHTLNTAGRENIQSLFLKENHHAF